MGNQNFCKIAILLAAFAAATAFGDIASAKVVVNESTKYYTIKGRSGLELSKAMLVGGARNINMRHAIAATSTRFDIGKAEVGVKNGRCVVKDVAVKLDIVYLYPSWPGKKSASKEAQRAWDSFFAELLKHERNHGAIAKAGSKRLEKELKAISASVASGCRDFGKNSMPRFERLSRDLKNQQLAFDARENQKTSKISRLQINLLKAK